MKKYSIHIILSLYIIAYAVFVFNDCDYPKYDYPYCALFWSSYLNSMVSYLIIGLCWYGKVNSFYKEQKRVLTLGICFFSFQLARNIFCFSFSVWGDYFDFIVSKGASIFVICVVLFLIVLPILKRK
jgi:hypothetical protein